VWKFFVRELKRSPEKNHATRNPVRAFFKILTIRFSRKRSRDFRIASKPFVPP
jgi:hypothetical protein